MRRLNLYQNIDILQSHKFTPEHIGQIFTAAVEDSHAKYLSRIHVGGTPTTKAVNRVTADLQRNIRHWFTSQRIDVVVRKETAGTVMAGIPSEYPHIKSVTDTRFLEGIMHQLLELEEPKIMTTIGNRVIEGATQYNGQNRKTDHYMMEYAAVTEALRAELQG